MPLHLVKMAVGVSGFTELARRQSDRLAAQRAAGAPRMLRHVTRNRPRRALELLDGGSIYWVMAGAIRARQRIAALEPVPEGGGRPRCAIVLDAALAPTEPAPRRAFQGWRYLEPGDAPADRAEPDDALGALPPGMRTELRRLGLA